MFKVQAYSKPSYLVLLLVTLAVALPCGVLAKGSSSQSQGGTSNLPYQVAKLPKQKLSSLEKRSILFMREEEKLARDVYLRLRKKYQTQKTFTNIAKSEQKHMDAMLALIEKYELKDPARKAIGKFKNKQLQALYDELTAAGVRSLVNALYVGTTIEETDIDDLAKALRKVDNRDIRLVYSKLKKGSENHLRAFVRALANKGVDYSPQILSQQDYNRIINGSRGRRK